MMDADVSAVRGDRRMAARRGMKDTTLPMVRDFPLGSTGVSTQRLRFDKASREVNSPLLPKI